MFSSRFMLFPTFTKTIGIKKIPGGGGGVDFTFYKNNAIFDIKNKKKKLKNTPSLTG